MVYNVVVADTARELVEEVNSYLAKGYIPYGELKIKAYKIHEGYVREWVQVVVKIEGNEPMRTDKYKGEE